MDTMLQAPSIQRRAGTLLVNSLVALAIEWSITRDLRSVLVHFFLIGVVSYYAVHSRSLLRLALAPYLMVSIALGFHFLWRAQGLTP